MDYQQDHTPYYYTFEITAGPSQETRVFSLPTLTDYTRDSLGRHTMSHPEVMAVFEKIIKHCEANPQININPLLDAIDIAAIKHEGQYGKDITGIPFIIHPLKVCDILLEEGKVTDVNVLVAALLHHTLEDNKATVEEIGERFGHEVGKILEEYSRENPKMEEEEEEKLVDHVAKMTHEGKLIKLATRIDRLSDLKDNPRIGWSQSEIDDYYYWTNKVLEAAKGTNVDLENALLTLIHSKSNS